MMLMLPSATTAAGGAPFVTALVTATGPTAAASPTSSYELIRIEVTKTVVGEQPQPIEYEAVIADQFTESAVTLTVTQPTYTEL